MQCEIFSIRKFDYTSDHYINKHRHNLSEIVFYLVTKGHTVIDGKKYEVQTGDIAFIPPKVMHDEYHIKQGGQVLCIIFKNESNIYDLPAGVMRFEDFKPIFDLALSMNHEVTEQPDYYELMLSYKFREMMIELTRRLTTRQKSCKDIVYIANFLKESYSQKIDFTDLASQCGYSYDYFRHIFKERFGLSPQNYVIRERLTNAKDMLLKTNLTLTDISLSCGFSDNAQFSVMFKKQYGMSPKQFQLLNKAGKP